MGEKKPIPPQGEIVIYQTQDGKTKIDVRFVDETVWLTQAQMVELFHSSKAGISEHIKHIFEEGELSEFSVVRKFRTTASDGKLYSVNHDNLDMIISLGYRVKSSVATQFRFSSSKGEKRGENAEKNTRAQAMKKAQAEYRKFQAQPLSPVEEAYLQTIRSLEETVKKNTKNHNGKKE